MTVEEDNKKLVTAFLADFTRGDVDALAGHLADDATWWVAGSLKGLSGTSDKKTWTAGIAGLSAGFPGGLRLTPLAFTAEGDRVAVEAESYGELANGRVYDNRYHFLFVVRDGKIVEAKEYLDTDHARATFLDP